MQLVCAFSKLMEVGWTMEEQFLNLLEDHRSSHIGPQTLSCLLVECLLSLKTMYL